MRRQEPRLASATVQDVIQPEFLLIVLAAALFSAGRTRSLAACAAISSGSAFAGLHAAPLRPMSAVPPGFVGVEGALFVIGAGLALGSAFSAVRSVRTPAAVLGSAAAAGGGLGIAVRALPYVLAAPTATLLAAAIVIGGGGLILVTGGRLAARALPPGDAPPVPPIGLAAIGAGALLAAASPATGAVLVGCALTGFGDGWCAGRPRGGRCPLRRC